MAAGALPDIGTEYGPCTDAGCGHRDCAQGRVDLERTCGHCGEAIALRLFYKIPETGDWVHATCEEAAVNPDKPPYR
jgi:hypothetical protein